MWNDYALARGLHVLAVLMWIGGVGLVTTVLIHRETGGNLTEVLTRLSSLIRGRFRFHRKVKTLSAEGRMAAWVLCLLPFFVCGAATTGQRSSVRTALSVMSSGSPGPTPTL